jgi:membrane-bound lytic murein transglycosylase B
MIAIAVAAAAVAVGVASPLKVERSAAPAAPAPDAVVPRAPQPLAARLAAADGGLREAVAAWRVSGRPAPSTEVTLYALYVQRALRMLSRDPALATATARRLPAPLARETLSLSRALRDLRRLAAGWRPHRIRIGPAEPLAALTGYYREAQRRFHVGWHVLAAVNHVESAFGRLRNDSVSGAQGPMQFMPATWRAYGMGGDVRDPHDAVMGAANYLRHAGAPRSYVRALYAYNPSQLYVDAVSRYARFIARDPDALAMLYSWQVFVHTARGGERRITGPEAGPSGAPAR